MLTFSWAEILHSVICAMIFGVFFAGFYSLLTFIKELVTESGRVIKQIVFFDKIFPLPSFKELKIEKRTGAFLSIISVIGYAVGFMLLSYYALDGELRFYMLALSFASFYLSNFAFFEVLSRIFGQIFRLMFICLTLPVRVILSIAKRLVNSLKTVVCQIKSRL